MQKFIRQKTAANATNITNKMINREINTTNNNYNQLTITNKMKKIKKLVAISLVSWVVSWLNVLIYCKLVA